MERVLPFIVCPIHRILACSTLKPRREAGYSGRFSFNFTKHATVSVGHIVGETGNSIVPFAVISLGIGYGTGEPAARKDYPR